MPGQASHLKIRAVPKTNRFTKPPHTPAAQIGGQHSLLLDTYAAYWALMYDIVNEQLDNLEESENVDELKTACARPPCSYTAAMEEVDRWVRGPNMRQGVPIRYGLEAGLTP